MNRIKSVDTFRGLAILAVIALHTSPFRANTATPGLLYPFLDALINQTARFAVPFFFLISGYFWGQKVRHGAEPVHLAHTTARRLACIFAVWSIIYVLPFDLTPVLEHGWRGFIESITSHLASLLKKPAWLLVQGTEGHLWFLVALICCTYMAAWFIRQGMPGRLLACAVCLYVAGLLAKAYIDTPIGLHLHFNTRNGPFFGLLPFVTGITLASCQPNTRWWVYGIAVFMLGSGLQACELYLLTKYFGAPPAQDYVSGTFFMGLGVGLIAISEHRRAGVAALGAIGRMSLGIYVIHYAFVKMLRPIDRATDAFLWQIGYVVLVLALSIVTVRLLSRHPTTRRIV